MAISNDNTNHKQQTTESKQETSSFKHEFALNLNDSTNKTSHAATNNNVTVESLLMSLDKIEKESENLLQFEKKPASNQSQNQASSTDLISASSNSEKINSIFAYLDEASNNSNTNGKSFTPKHLKDYKYELAEFSNEHMFPKNELSPPPTPKPKPTTNKKSSNESLHSERDKPLRANSSLTRKNSTPSLQTQHQNQIEPSKQHVNSTFVLI